MFKSICFEQLLCTSPPVLSGNVRKTIWRKNGENGADTRIDKGCKRGGKEKKQKLLLQLQPKKTAGVLLGSGYNEPKPCPFTIFAPRWIWIALFVFNFYKETHQSPNYGSQPRGTKNIRMSMGCQMFSCIASRHSIHLNMVCQAEKAFLIIAEFGS